ncbi:hypothetical protein MRX96_024590 [Rhipicephalus microplus]
MEPVYIGLRALEVPEVTVNGPTLEPSVIAMMRDHNLALADVAQGDHAQQFTISVLIGSDHYWRVVTRRVERFTDTLCAVEAIFGWVIGAGDGKVKHRLSSHNMSALFLACSDKCCTAVLPQDPSDIWRLDTIGISDGEDDVSKHPALIHFRSTVHNSAGRYKVPLMVSRRVQSEAWLKQRSSDDPDPAAVRAGGTYRASNGASRGRPFRVKRSAAAKHLLTAKNIRTRVDERRRANVKLPCRGKARAKRSSRYALNAFSINPKPANKSGGYYTLFARVSEAVLQDLMARNPPAGESNLSRHHQSPNHYSGELFQYVVNSTAGQPRLPLPPKAGHSWRRGAATEVKKQDTTREGLKCIYRKNSIICYQAA